MSGEETHRRRAEQPVSLQLFEGNMHYDTPDIRRFDPVPAQYVRVYPERWSPAGIGMRLEVLGCDWTGKGISSSYLAHLVLWSWHPGRGQGSQASLHTYCLVPATFLSHLSREVFCPLSKITSVPQHEFLERQVLTTHRLPKFN